MYVFSDSISVDKFFCREGEREMEKERVRVIYIDNFIFISKQKLI